MPLCLLPNGEIQHQSKQLALFMDLITQSLTQRIHLTAKGMTDMLV